MCMENKLYVLETMEDFLGSSKREIIISVRAINEKDALNKMSKVLVGDDIISGDNKLDIQNLLKR